MSNKELFEQKMNVLATNIIDKTSSSEKQTIQQLTTTVETETADPIPAIYVKFDESSRAEYIVDPINYEPYIGYRWSAPSSQEVELALEKICQDYHFVRQDDYLRSEVLRCIKLIDNVGVDICVGDSSYYVVNQNTEWLLDGAATSVSLCKYTPML